MDCKEVAPKVGALATPNPNYAESPAGRVLKHAFAASPKAPTLVRPSVRTKAITFGPRLASTCFRTRRDPIGLAQRFLNQGGSIKIGSQIFPDFVQVQTVFSDFQGIRTLLIELTDKDHKLSPPSCNMRASWLSFLLLPLFLLLISLSLWSLTSISAWI